MGKYSKFYTVNYKMRDCPVGAKSMVPEDISVTGFGKFGMEQFAYSPLTTIDNGFHTIGEVAAEVLLGHPVPYPKSEHGVYLVPGKIVMRESLTEVRKNKTGKEKKGKVR